MEALYHESVLERHKKAAKSYQLAVLCCQKESEGSEHEPCHLVLQQCITALQPTGIPRPVDALWHIVKSPSISSEVKNRDPGLRLDTDARREQACTSQLHYGDDDPYFVIHCRSR